MAGAITRGDATVTRVKPSELHSTLQVLRQAGCELEVGEDRVRLWRSGPIKPVDITTLPYPGFPTDMQAQLMALLSVSSGTSRIVETIFENRFMHVPELSRMGASIEISGNTARVEGVSGLRAATVMATDLRASASLVLAGLAASGPTEVLRLYHLDRGYSQLVEKLSALGAHVSRVPEERSDVGKVVALRTAAG